MKQLDCLGFYSLWVTELWFKPGELWFKSPCSLRSWLYNTWQLPPTPPLQGKQRSWGKTGRAERGGFLLQPRRQWESESVHCSVLSDCLRPHGLWPSRLRCPWDSPGKNTGVGCHFLLQGLFPTQVSNPSLPHCRQTLYCLSHQGSPGEYDTALNQRSESCRLEKRFEKCVHRGGPGDFLWSGSEKEGRDVENSQLSERRWFFNQVEGWK